ncbi:MAG: GNAT family N-acetyltransferase [Bacillota bacterium]|nr:GNAT family N-acetyltransferase [Bacillota bacterium]
MKWRVQPACSDNIPQVVGLFLESFEDTIVHFFEGGSPSGDALQDFFGFLLKEEPESFWVAMQEGENERLVGYIVVVPHLPLLWRRAVLGGYVLRWTKRCLRGEYGVNFKNTCRALKNKFAFWRHSRSFPSYSSQILSLAVTRDCRGQGLSRQLLDKGMLFLKKLGKIKIKLEVRLWNKAALQLYQSYGFIPVGTTIDSQGEWLVMVKNS